jgi:hypothetical protein
VFVGDIVSGWGKSTARNRLKYATAVVDKMLELVKPSQAEMQQPDEQMADEQQIAMALADVLTHPSIKEYVSKAMQLAKDTKGVDLVSALPARCDTAGHTDSNPVLVSKR